MIVTEKIRDLPRWVEFQLAPYAAQEVRIAKQLGINVVAQALEARVAYHNDSALMVAGVNQPTMLGATRFWFLLCRDFAPRHVRGLLREFDAVLDRYPVLHTDIETTYRSGCRFAKFFGFAPTGNEHSAYGRHYEVYEARR